MATSNVYNKGLVALNTKKINLSTDTIKGILLESGYTPDLDADEFVSDVTGEELSGGGYARVTLTGLLVDEGTGVVQFKSDDVTFPALTTTTARYMIIAHSSGSDATSYLLYLLDFGTDQVATSQDLTATAPVDGWIEWTR